MSTFKVALPSNAPGGIEGQRSEHFGRCELFTIVTVVDGEVQRVEMVANADHDTAGCMASVGVLRDQQVDAVVVGGIGRRPLQALQESGVRVLFADPRQFSSVQSAVSAMLADELTAMRLDLACAGHSHCH